MNFYINIFNNREKAIIIWLLIFFAWALCQKNIRTSFLHLLKVLFSKKIFILLIAMFAYSLLEVFLLLKVNLYDVSMLKDVILWFLGTAFVMMMNSDKASQDEKYFKKMLLGSLTVVLIVEFIVNFHIFNLVAELILLPILVCIVAIVAYSEIKKEYIQVNRVMNYILGIFGTVLFVFAIYNLINDFQSFATFDNLRSFLLPPTLTIMFLPFIYSLALLMTYESMFAPLSIWVKDDKKLAGFTKRQIFKACHFNLRKLNKFSKESAVMFTRLNNRNDVLSIIKELYEKSKKN